MSVVNSLFHEGKDEMNQRTGYQKYGGDCKISTKIILSIDEISLH